MHDDFADWYRPCTSGTEGNLTGDLLVKRWQGVEKIAASPGHDVLDLARLALARNGVPAPFLSKFRAAFKEADPTFQMSGNDLELGVLAGSTLCQIFAEVADEADEASLALLCASGITKGPDWSEPFVSHASAYMDNRLRNIRAVRRVHVPQLATKKLKQQFDLFATKLAESNPSNTSEAAKQLSDAWLQAMTAATETAAAAIGELDRQSDLRREETDVLWWMTAGVSRDLGDTFRQLKTAAASVVAGKELADLVSPPGVLPAKSILHSIITPATGRDAGKPIPINAAVNASTAEWRGRLVKGTVIERIEDLCPLLAALKKSLTTDEADGWMPAYKKAYGVDPKTALAPVDLAHQVYRECLLARIAAA